MARINNPGSAPMAGVYIPDWARLLKMHWPRTAWLEEPDFSFALREIRRTIHRDPPCEDELQEVVAWMAGPESKQTYAPTLREMIINIYMFRKQMNRTDSSALAGNIRLVEEVKRYMQAAGSWRERWNILCQPSLYAGLERDPNYDETLVLAKWAEEFWPEWEERVAAIKLELLAGMRKALPEIFNNESRRRKESKCRFESEMRAAS